MGTFVDLSGQRFGRLTVLHRGNDYVSPKGYHGAVWVCKCDCGKVLSIRGCNLRSGASTSCGCNKRINPNRKTHGQKDTRLYRIWVSMKQRCYNRKCKSYKDYGARGITVCDEWLSDFQAFYKWALLSGYKDTLTIDRIDYNGNYSPSNCRWADTKTQANNTRHNHMITHNGSTLTMKQWSEKTGIKYQKIKDRLNSCGWSVEDALTIK